MQETKDTTSPPKVLEMKLPITWLITISIPILWAAIQLYFTVGALKDTVIKLDSTVTTLTKITTDAQRDISILSYRVDAMDKRIKEIQHDKD